MEPREHRVEGIHTCSRKQQPTVTLCSAASTLKKKEHGTHNNPKVKGASNPNKNCRQIAERLALRSRKAGSNGQVWAGSVIGAWGLHLILAKLKTSGMEGRGG